MNIAYMYTLVFQALTYIPKQKTLEAKNATP